MSLGDVLAAIDDSSWEVSDGNDEELSSDDSDIEQDNDGRVQAYRAQSLVPQPDLGGHDLGGDDVEMSSDDDPSPSQSYSAYKPPG